MGPQTCTVQRSATGHSWLVIDQLFALGLLRATWSWKENFWAPTRRTHAVAGSTGASLLPLLVHSLACYASCDDSSPYGEESATPCFLGRLLVFLLKNSRRSGKGRIEAPGHPAQQGNGRMYRATTRSSKLEVVGPFGGGPPLKKLQEGFTTSMMAS